MHTIANRFGLPTLLGLTVLLASSFANLQTSEIDAVDAEAQVGLQARFGFDGKIKLGHWSPVFLSFPADWKPTRFVIQSSDGNGVTVNYSGKLAAVSDDTAQAWMRLGRSSGSVSVELFDADDNSLGDIEIPLQNNNQIKVIDSTVPVVLCIEPQDLSLIHI